MRAMSPSPFIPAAQYIRMSTEHQKFSWRTKRAALRLYAEAQKFAVVKTYVDSGKTGVVLKHREGLASLLRDVVQGDQPYRAILVYDVSRWGRFQDTDEGAYYEHKRGKAHTRRAGDSESSGPPYTKRFRASAR